MISWRIDTDKELLRCIPKHWLSFFDCSDDQDNKIIIHLGVESGLNDLCLPDGWSKNTLNGIQQFVYVSSSIASFSLAYDAPEREMKIFVRKPLDGYVRSGILYGMLIALYRSYIGFHGVTLIFRDQVVVLSGPSGIGKTTLAQLLGEYSDTRIINGDFALLSLNNDRVVFEPTPFCGTSRICLDERVNVDRIVFLKQSGENSWKELNGRQAVLSFLNNAFIPTFDGRLERVIQNNILSMLPFVKTSVFAFAPTEEAAKFFARQIDH